MFRYVYKIVSTPIWIRLTSSSMVYKFYKIISYKLWGKLYRILYPKRNLIIVGKETCKGQGYIFWPLYFSIFLISFNWEMLMLCLNVYRLKTSKMIWKWHMSCWFVDITCVAWYVYRVELFIYNPYLATPRYVYIFI